jgi:hypothetical protein
MAWLYTTVSFGVITGPALGGMLPRNDLHLDLRFGRFMVDSFSIPFCGGVLRSSHTSRGYPVAGGVNAFIAGGQCEQRG